MNGRIVSLFALALAALVPVTAAAAPAPGSTVSTREARTPAPALPDVELFDQDGRKVRLPELIRGRTVAINFVFTTCTTVCSPLTAIFSRVQTELGPRLGKEVHLLSITLDPAVDTPERLDAYASQFGRKPGWTFVTGKPADVSRVLRAFGAHVANKESHTPMVLFGNEPAGRWSRLFGLSAPARIVEEIDALLKAPAEKEAAIDPATGSAQYFTALEVVDHDGRVHRFYSDLLKGRKVLIHFAFTNCKTACPPILGHLAKVQEKLGDRLEKEVRILTLTVDPGRDSPAALKETAKSLGAKPGWYFLTGTHANMEAILRKLGGYAEDPEAHSTALYIGDSATGNWVKAIAMSPVEQIVDAVVRLNDPLPAAAQRE